jgi:hypothetical protein
MVGIHGFDKVSMKEKKYSYGIYNLPPIPTSPPISGWHQLQSHPPALELRCACLSRIGFKSAQVFQKPICNFVRQPVENLADASGQNNLILHFARERRAR